MTAAVNIFAHLPEVPTTGKYRLGSSLQPAPDDLWLNGDDGTGVLTSFAEPEGWEGLTFITPLDTAGGRDGALIGPGSIAPRVLECEGAIVSPDEITHRNYIQALRAKLTPRASLVWDQFDFGEQVRMGIVCRPQGDFRAVTLKGHRPGGVAATVKFSLVAANPPWKLATGAPEQSCAKLPVSEVTGRTYDKTYNYNYGSVTNPGGYLLADNRGNVPAYPVFSVTGPVDNAIITNETTGQGFVLTSTVPASNTVTIDSRTGIVSPSQYRIAGRPFALAPGVNTIRWRATSGTYNADASLCVTWRSTWE